MDTSGFVNAFPDNATDGAYLYVFPDSFESNEEFLDLVTTYAQAPFGLQEGGANSWEPQDSPTQDLSSDLSDLSDYTSSPDPYNADVDFELRTAFEEQEQLQQQLQQQQQQQQTTNPIDTNGFFFDVPQAAFEPVKLEPVHGPVFFTAQTAHVYPPACPTPTAAGELEILLQQKKRGSGGVWQTISHGERIRVDKSKGKLIKVLVRSVGRKVNLKDKAIEINFRLFNLQHPDGPTEETDAFTVKPPSRPPQNRVDPGNAREFRLKLTKICKNQLVFVTVTTPDGVQHSASSVEFRSDDNGKVQAPKKRKRSAQPDNSNELSDFLREGLKRYATTGSNIAPAASAAAGNPGEFVNLLARTLVPVILDNFQQQLEFNKRIKVESAVHGPFNFPVKCEVA